MEGGHLTALSGSHDALERFKQSPDTFDLVITDMTMPKMTGETLARQIKHIRPDIPVILCTGFSPQFMSEDEQPADVDAVLRKPVFFREMAEMLRNIMAP